MEDGKPIRVTGNRESPVYHGFCCTRGQALPEVMASPERLLHSMKRGPEIERARKRLAHLKQRG